jgi:hypothetical protein
MSTLYVGNGVSTRRLGLSYMRENVERGMSLIFNMAGMRASDIETRLATDRLVHPPAEF